MTALLLCFSVLISCAVGNNFTLVFPQEFAWGTATAAYQVEGAWNLSGRGPSIWDTFTHAGKCFNNDTGDVADDHYHRVAEDIAIMKDIGVGWYRMSISWSRVLPTGKLPVNDAGIQHYKSELQQLKAAGLKVLVTLYHWDLPQGLHDDYKGWLDRKIVDDFKAYAEVCFENFGQWVDMWATHNEPWVQTWLGYGIGGNAPGRCSDRSRCPEGDSWSEPYIAAHNIILSHGYAVKVFREKYQKKTGAKIGMVLNFDWGEPKNPNSTADQEANQRYCEFFLGWFADPIYKGDYPESMKKFVGSRLPNFTAEDILVVNGSHDYFGLNHYTSSYVENRTQNTTNFGWEFDHHVISTRDRDGIPIGPRADSSWLYVVPWGIRRVINFVSNRYGNPDLFITENGVSVPNETALPLEMALNDTFRVNFYGEYLSQVSKAISEDKVNVRGYFAWSLMDNFEWTDGYSRRFGLVYVNYTNNQSRHKKLSAKFYGDIIRQNSLNDEGDSVLIVFAVVPALVLIGIVVYLLAKERMAKTSEYGKVGNEQEEWDGEEDK